MAASSSSSGFEGTPQFQMAVAKAVAKALAAKAAAKATPSHIVTRIMDENDATAMACKADLCKHATVPDLVMLARKLRVEVKEQLNMKTRKVTIDKAKLHEDIMAKLRMAHAMLGQQPAKQDSSSDTAPAL